MTHHNMTTYHIIIYIIIIFIFMIITWSLCECSFFIAATLSVLYTH